MTESTVDASPGNPESRRVSLSFRTPSLLPTPHPSLEELKLSHILNGETCPPISFPDFSSFIANKEHSTENLLFVIWFRSYQERWNELDPSVKNRVVTPSTRLGDRWSPFGFYDRAVREGRMASVAEESSSDTRHSNYPATTSASSTLTSKEQVNTFERGLELPRPTFDRQASGSGNFRPCSWTAGNKPCNCGRVHGKEGEGEGERGTQTSFPSSRLAVPVPILHRSSYPALPPMGSKLLPPGELPMRDEALRAFATFLKKGGSRELGISDELRQFTKTCLERSTAPECFLPIYEEMYQVIESQSLPHFLSYASSNINRPKQLFWYYVGTIDLLIGILAFVIPTLLLSQSRYAYRAIRLPSTIFASFGAMQFYSAYRGFCTQVWGRSSRQVRPWEMDDFEDEESDVEWKSATGPGDDIALVSGSGTSNNNISPMVQVGRPVETPVSLFAENVFGSYLDKLQPLDFVTSPEEHPLSELNGVTTSTTAVAAEPMTPTSSIALLPDGEGVMTEAQLRQLAIRRATIKVPDASLAFPISQDEVVPATPKLGSTNMSRNVSGSGSGTGIGIIATAIPGTRSRKSSSRPSVGSQGGTYAAPISSASIDAKKRSEISPFDEPPGDAGAGADFLPGQPRVSLASAPDSIQQRSSQLATLLSRSGRNFSKSGGDQTIINHGIDPIPEEKMKIFGPERLVEDPRVTALFKSVIRDILVVGISTGVIWLALVFAVPCAGLLSR